MDKNYLSNLILTPEDFLRGAEHTDFRKRVMERMQSPKIQEYLELYEQKRNQDWSRLADQIVGR